MARVWSSGEILDVRNLKRHLNYGTLHLQWHPESHSLAQ